MPVNGYALRVFPAGELVCALLQRLYGKKRSQDYQVHRICRYCRDNCADKRTFCRKRAHAVYLRRHVAHKGHIIVLLRYACGTCGYEIIRAVYPCQFVLRAAAFGKLGGFACG